MTLKVFSAFAGYGTDNFALKQLGIDFECVGFSEIDKTAIKCFELNHSKPLFTPEPKLSDLDPSLPKITGKIEYITPKNYGDITKINPNDLPDFDLFTGGFPCQSFSVAGKRLGELDPRGTLFYDIIRICEIKQPKYIFLENVKGLTGKKHKQTFDKIISELNRIGYGVSWKVLNTKDYGIPQNRERVYFVCIKGCSDMSWFEFPKKEELKLLIKDILETNPIREEIKNKRVNSKLSSPTGKDNPKYELKGDTPSGVSRQKDRIYTTISPCLNCTLDEILIEIDSKIIKLIGKEHFRLQGFLNDEICLEGFTERQIKKLAGNGQSVNVVSKIFKNFLPQSLNTQISKEIQEKQ